jgi:Na+/alanine symporter
MEHFKISDSVGVPSTMAAIMLNVMKMFNLSNISMSLTIVISLLSIAYLSIGIALRLKEYKKQSSSSSTTE